MREASNEWERQRVGERWSEKEEEGVRPRTCVKGRTRVNVCERNKAREE